MYQQVTPMFAGQEANCIKRILDSAFIPFDPANTDYQEYLKWLAEGNTPLRPPAPPPPTREQQEAARQSAYAKEADPLYFKWQAGESSQEAWVAKRAEIKSRYPYPELE
jgi:hypothetical protein